MFQRISLIFLMIWSLSWFVGMGCGAPSTTTLSAIRPAQGSNQQDLPVKILGRGLDSTARAWLINAKEERVDLLDLRVMTPTEAEALLPKGASAGRYDLIWQQGGREIRLGAAFESIPGTLTIDLIDVGQGDAMLIRTPEKVVLIDAGKEDTVEPLLSFLREEGIARIDIVIGTHFHADHIGGIAKVVYGEDGRAGTEDDRAPALHWWDRGGFSPNTSYSQAREAYRSVYKALDGRDASSFPKVDLGDGATLSVLASNGSFLRPDGSIENIACGSDENCRSVGVLITVGGFRLWTAGDLTGGGIGTPDAEAVLLGSLGVVDVYRAHHHGSRTSSTQALLDTLQPRVILVSAGNQNTYCHPDPEVIQRLLRFPSLQFFLTTLGISDASRCSQTTEAALAPMAGRAVVNTGHLRIQAGKESYSIRVSSGDIFAFDVK
jgi:beta-lactamase superfamily II metal-dependent hydrolase